MLIGKEIIISDRINGFVLELLFYRCKWECREGLVGGEYELASFVLLSISHAFFIVSTKLGIGLLCIIWWNFQLNTVKLD
jgi:hypothetical protein